jgi:hypothetical protein
VAFSNDLDQNSNYPLKNDKVLMSPADQANLFGKNVDSTKARPVYCKHFCTEMGPAVGKNGLEIKAAITMPPIQKLSTLDRLALNFL